MVTYYQGDIEFGYPGRDEISDREAISEMAMVMRKERLRFDDIERMLWLSDMGSGPLDADMFAMSMLKRMATTADVGEVARFKLLDGKVPASVFLLKQRNLRLLKSTNPAVPFWRFGPMDSLVGDAVEASSLASLMGSDLLSGRYAMFLYGRLFVVMRPKVQAEAKEGEVVDRHQEFGARSIKALLYALDIEDRYDEVIERCSIVPNTFGSTEGRYAFVVDRELCEFIIRESIDDGMLADAHEDVARAMLATVPKISDEGAVIHGVVRSMLARGYAAEVMLMGRSRVEVVPVIIRRTRAQIYKDFASRVIEARRDGWPVLIYPQTVEEVKLWAKENGIIP